MQMRIANAVGLQIHNLNPYSFDSAQQFVVYMYMASHGYSYLLSLVEDEN